MKRRSLWNRTALAALAVILCTATVARADENWTVDFDDAKTAAAEQQKSILMEFTGSDWCPPCKALHEQVLSKELFLTAAPQHFVLLKLDNPRDKSKQTEKEIEQYKELSAKYKIEGVPTVILADQDGKPYAKFVGYGGTAAEDYVAQLTEKTSALQQRDEHLAKAETAEGLERAKHLDAALGLIDIDLAMSTYEDVVSEIIALDSEDQAGLKGKYEGLLKASQVTAAVERIRREFRAKPDEAIARIDELIADMKPAGEALQQAVYYKAVLKYGTDKEATKTLLLEARQAAPKSEFAAQNIDRVLKQVFGLDPEKLEEQP